MYPLRLSVIIKVLSYLLLCKHCVVCAIVFVTFSSIQGHSCRRHSTSHIWFPISIIWYLCLYLAPSPTYYCVLTKMQRYHV